MPSRVLVARKLSEIFKILAHPDRVRLVEELSAGEKDVNTLHERLNLPAARVSQHLALLRAHRIVEERRDGRRIFYHLTQPELAAWIVDGLAFLGNRLAGDRRGENQRRQPAPASAAVHPMNDADALEEKGMNKIAAGIVRFQTETYPRKKELFRELAAGQSPEALFITCSDSRIDPNLITQTEPGELFICRNAGNIVPPHTNHTGAMTAAIEFAVGALNVPHIIICGHSGCGALKGALNLDSLGEFPHVREWLSYARAASLIVEERCENLPEEDKLNELIRQNVIMQMQHLKTHPYVAARLAARRTEIHGWIYDIATGDVVAYDEAANEFVPVAEHYREAVKKAISGAGCTTPERACAASSDFDGEGDSG